MKTKNRTQNEYSKVLCHGDEGFQLYVEELVEECGNFVRLAAKLKQMPVEASDEREDIEMELYSSLSHLEAHAHELREWWDRLDESLPD